jgi:hypothetical protein
MELNDYKASLIDQVENSAWWRSEKALEYPGDTRNMTASESLRHLAAQLKDIPADHPKIWELWRMDFSLRLSGASNEEFGTIDNEAISEELRAFGFSGGEPTNPEEFLDCLIAVYRRELEEW